MRSMSPAVQTKPDSEYDREKAEQAKIAADVTPAAPEPSAPKAEPAEPTVTLRPVNVDTYPLYVSVVGTDDLYFASADSTVEVSPAVAEQITYLRNVEVAS